jgi:hypothetical protein
VLFGSNVGKKPRSRSFRATRLAFERASLFYRCQLVYSPTLFMALTTPPRRSARLGSHCTRKRAWVPDSDQLPPSSSKLPPEPSPRWIRAQKRQKILDGASLPPDSNATPGKRKSLVAGDEQHHHRVVGRKRKENILNGAAAKISITLDTRQGSGNNVCPRLFLFSILY